MKMAKTKYTALYKTINENPGIDDTAAKKKLKGQIDTDGDFYKTKARLINKLTGYVFLLDPKQQEFSPLMRNKLECYKNLLASLTFGHFGKKETSKYFADKAFKSAKKYEIYEIALLSARLLRQSHLFTGDLKTSAKFSREAKQAKQILDILDNSNLMIERIQEHFINSTSLKPHLERRAELYLKLHAAYVERYNLFILKINQLRLEVFKDQLAFRYKDTIPICNKAIELMEKSYLKNKIAFGEFHFYKLLAWLYLRDYSSANQSSEKCNRLFSKYRYNWFIYKEYAFILLLHQKEYDTAVKLYLEVTQSESIATLPDRNKQKWKLYEAYLRLLSMVFRIRGMDEVIHEKIESFIDNLSVFKKDKQGFFIPLFIARLLFFFLKKDMEALYYLSKKIDNYYYRFLGDKTTLRTKQFFQLMKELIKLDLEPQKSKELLDQHKKEFEKTPLNSMFNFEGVEVIPYEQLCEMMEYSLQKEW